MLRRFQSALCLLALWAPFCGAEAADRADDDYAVALWLYATQRYDLAADEFADFAKHYPSHPKAEEALLMQGRALVKLGKFEEASAVLKRLYDKPARADLLPEILFELARAEENSGNRTRALKLYADFSKQFPQHHLKPWALEHRAVLLMNLERYREAAGLLEPFVRTFLTGPEAEKRVSEMQKRLRKQDPSLPAAFRELLERSWVNLGLALLGQGELKAAAQAFTSFLKRFQGSKFAGAAKFGLAEAKYLEGNFQEASELYKGLLGATGDKAPDAAFRYALCLYRMKDYRRAAEAFRTCAGRYPKSPTSSKALRYAGLCLYLAGNWQGALEELTRCVRRDPRDTEALYWLGMAHLKRKNPIAALVAFEKILLQDPQSPRAADALLAMGQAYQAEQSGLKAAEAFSKFAKQHPDNPQAPAALYQAAVILYREKQYDRTRELVQQCLKRYPGSSIAPRCEFLAGELAFLSQDYSAARRHFEAFAKAYPADPDAPKASLRLAWIAHKEGKYEQGARFALEALKLPETAAPARYLLGLCRFAQERWEEAAESLLQYAHSKGEAPYRFEALLKAAVALRHTGKISEAAQILDTLLKQKPQTSLLPEILYERAELARSEGRLDEAEKRCREFLQRFKNHRLVPFVLYTLGLVQFRRREFEAGAQTFHTIITDHPESKAALQAVYQEAVCLEKAGRTEEALRGFEKFLSAAGDGALAPQAALALGVCLEKVGRYKEAVQEFSELLSNSKDPQLREQALYEKAYCLSKIGERKEAAQTYRTLLEQFPETKYGSDACFFLAEEAFLHKKYGEAEKLYREALQRGAPSELRDKILYRIGWCAFARQKYEQALAAFKSLIERFPQSPLREESAFQAAEASLKAGRPQDALPFLEPLASGGKGSRASDAAFRLGEVYILLNRYREAETVLRKLLQKLPEKDERAAEAKCNLAKALYYLGRYTEAEGIFRSVTQMTTSEAAASAQFYLGECALAQGRPKEALRAYFRVVTIWKAYSRWAAAAQYQIGSVYQAEGRISEARKAFEAVVRRYPGTKWAEAAQKKLTALTG